MDLIDAAYKCSCPSRKLPCKHTLALLLMLTGGVSIPDGVAPEFVEEWSANRAKRAEAKQTRAAQPAPAAPDPEARSKRIEKREGRITAGLDQLETWISDIVSTGLAAARSQGPAFWSQMSGRLVDAQAPGLARRVRDIGDLSISSPQWQSDLLAGLGRLQLLIDAYRNLDRLPSDLAAQVRTLVGWTQDQDAVRQSEGIRDLWHVVGRRQIQEDQLRTQYTWLYGEQSARFALLLEFAVGPQPLPAGLTVGQRLDTELAFFDGYPRLRALEKTRYVTLPIRPALPASAEIVTIQNEYAKLLANNPWLERHPVLLGPVRPVLVGSRLFFEDVSGGRVAVLSGFQHHWNLIALAGSETLRVFGEWDGMNFEPHTIESGGRLFTIAKLGELPVLSQVA